MFVSPKELGQVRVRVRVKLLSYAKDLLTCPDFVSWYHGITKKYTLPRLLLILAYITLRNYFDFVSSYHEKIYLAQASLIYLGFIIYYHMSIEIYVQ